MKQMIRFMVPVLAALGVQTPAHAQKIKVACMGDSITYGAGITAPGTTPATWEGDKYRAEGPALLDQDSYPGVLQILLGENYDVRNFGGSGRTVTGPGPNLYPYFNSKRDSNTPSGGYQAALDFGPDLVLLMLGTNDTKLQLWPSSEPRFKEDYIKLVRAIQNSPSKPYVVICYPIPIEDSPKPNPCSGITESNRLALLPLINQVIAETGAGFINTNTGMPPFTGLLKDQVHPGREGAKRIAQIMDAGLPMVSRASVETTWTIHGPRPKVVLTAPSDRQVITTNDSVTVSCSAEPETATTEGIGSGAPASSPSPIAKVEFFLNGTKLGESTSAPYETKISKLPVGRHSITARATNKEGISRTSPANTLIVSDQPIPESGISFTGNHQENFNTLAREVKPAILSWVDNQILTGWHAAHFSNVGSSTSAY